MNELFKSLLDETENDFATIMEDDEDTDISGFVDTGSYTLNALLSGSIFGGAVANRGTGFAGEPSTGKTFYALNICEEFLKKNPNGFIFYFESESAISRQMLIDRGIDIKRFAFVPVMTVQEFRTQALRILDKYLDTKEKDRLPMAFVLDSLGNLSTKKEMDDIKEGNDTRDMTRAQLIRGTFRALTLKFGRAKVPFFVTNHVYEVIGSYVPLKKMNGGSGFEYAASQIVFLSKKKYKDAKKNNTGVIITATLKKSRFTVETKSVETLLDYKTGLDRYFGLVTLALQFGIFKKVGNTVTYKDEKLGSEPDMERNPEKYFNDEILQEIDKFCKEEFLYGNTNFANAEEIA